MQRRGIPCQTSIRQKLTGPQQQPCRKRHGPGLTGGLTRPLVDLLDLHQTSFCATANSSTSTRVIRRNAGPRGRKKGCDKRTPNPNRETTRSNKHDYNTCLNRCRRPRRHGLKYAAAAATRLDGSQASYTEGLSSGCFPSCPASGGGASSSISTRKAGPSRSSNWPERRHHQNSMPIRNTSSTDKGIRI